MYRAGSFKQLGAGLFFISSLQRQIPEKKSKPVTSCNAAVFNLPCDVSSGELLQFAAFLPSSFVLRALGGSLEGRGADRLNGRDETKAEMGGRKKQGQK